MIALAILAFFIIFTGELLLYTLFIPHPSQKPLKSHSLDKHLGSLAYVIAYILSLLRAPLGLLPYLVKLFIFFVLRTDYESSRSTYKREVINVFGDIANLCMTFLLVFVLVGVPAFPSLTFLIYLPIMAELVRLLTERVPMLFSADWQLFPIAASFTTALRIKDRAACGREQCGPSRATFSTFPLMMPRGPPLCFALFKRELDQIVT